MAAGLDHARRGKGKGGLTSKPASKQGRLCLSSATVMTTPIRRIPYNETQEVVEDGNALSNNPTKYPERKPEHEPGAPSHYAALMQAVGPAKHANVDVLGGHVSVDDSGDDDLRVASTSKVEPPHGNVLSVLETHTVGIAMP